MFVYVHVHARVRIAGQGFWGGGRLCTRKVVAGNSLENRHQAFIKLSDHGINLVRAGESGVSCILAECCSQMWPNEGLPLWDVAF